MGNTLLFVLFFILIGQILRQIKSLPKSFSPILNKFIINISLPSIIIMSISRLKLSSEMLIPIGTHWVAFFIHFLLIFLVAKVFKFSKSILGVLLIVTTLGNTAFLGIPLMTAFFGEGAVPYAILYDQLGSGIGFILIGSFLLPMFSEAESKSLKQIVIGLLTFPPFVALIIGFVCIKFPLPTFAMSSLKFISITLIPCAMIAVGFNLKLKMSVDKIKPLAIGLGLKLLVLPGIIFVLMNIAFPEKEVIHSVSILQSGMPPMVTAGVIAIGAKIEEELAAAFVGYGLLISFITLSFYNYFL